MIQNKTCTNCGSVFGCGATEPDGTCWCSALPRVVPLTEGAECLCPVCLAEKIKVIQQQQSEPKSGEYFPLSKQ
jgi:hypothetical protein